MAIAFTVRFRSRLTKQDLDLLQASLGLTLGGEFHNYFNPYRGGESRGERVVQGPITLYLTAVGEPPDVYMFQAFVDAVAKDDIVAEMETRVREVVGLISDLEYRQAPTLHFFVPHIGFGGFLGRPGGSLYRLVCTEPILFEGYVPRGAATKPSGTWVPKADEMFWVLGSRLSGLEVNDVAANQIAEELDREWSADAREELYSPKFPP